jgi:hypothetical protein
MAATPEALKAKIGSTEDLQSDLLVLRRRLNLSRPKINPLVNLISFSD